MDIYVYGKFCTLKNGLGICRLHDNCSDSIDAAENSEASVFCNFHPDLQTICCRETIQLKPLRKLAWQEYTGNKYHIPNRRETLSRKQRQVTPWWFNSSHFDGNKHTAVKREPVDKQNSPWWLSEKAFVEITHTTTTTTQSVNSENVESPWWLRQNAFHSPEFEVLPATSPPATVLQQAPQSTESQRISEIKCNEYSKLAEDQGSAPELVRIDISKCGFNRLEDFIAGGDEAKAKEFPHMAVLGFYDKGNVAWRCGGSLISEFYVLTAAHCSPIRNPPIIARLGELNLKYLDDEAAPVNYAIVERIRHPEYKPPAKYNDIAVLKLDRRVEFSDFIRPACLYNRDIFEFDRTVATGWGRTEYAEPQSDILLKAVISIIDNEKCDYFYKPESFTKKLSNGIVQSMMCAGDLTGHKDTCQGDSGGPIQITRQISQCVYSIIGITSFGKMCATKNSPGVYTRVSSFVPWIESIVWPDS